jgi:hypothetical protein
MIPFLRPGRRELPAMTLEGVLGPNGRLDEARGIEVDAPDAICAAVDGALLFSSGPRLMALDAWGAEPRLVATFDAPVTALCTSPGGRVAVGLAGGRVAVLDASARPEKGWALPAGRLASVVDCAFLSEEDLLLVDCGQGAGDDLLARAAWDDEARGQVAALGRSGEMRLVASGLHCPMGVSLDAGGGLLLPLLERACIVDGSGAVRQAGYPGYLGRLRRTGNGYVLACLSRRDALIEFLKTERAFVAEMKARIEPRHWIAPSTSPDFTHDFPIELGATRLFGEVKPWAPSFSYGLLIEMGANLMPVGSAQSRANGRRHAICDATVWNGELIAVSKASGEILNLGAAA